MVPYVPQKDEAEEIDQTEKVIMVLAMAAVMIPIFIFFCFVGYRIFILLQCTPNKHHYC